MNFSVWFLRFQIPLILFQTFCLPFFLRCISYFLTSFNCKYPHGIWVLAFLVWPDLIWNLLTYCFDYHNVVITLCGSLLISHRFDFFWSIQVIFFQIPLCAKSCSHDEYASTYTLKEGRKGKRWWDSGSLRQSYEKGMKGASMRDDSLNR